MPKRKVSNYTQEFKRSSARLAANSDQSINKTAEELGVHVSTLHGWVRRYEPNANKQPATGPDNLAEELKQLRKENARLRQERDILKKAAAYFANEVG